MKRTFKKLLRTGMSLVLVASMMVGMCASAFAVDESKINYVSLGDSMTNGYCFTGYNQGSINAADFLAGNGVYGEDAYPNAFAAYLEAQNPGKTVNHSKLAVSAMRAEDLNYLLGGREMPTDGWFGQVEHYSGTSGDALKGIYQEAIADADVITMGIGNAAFGAYMVQYFTRMMGVMGGSLDADEKVDLEKALAVLDPEQQAVILDAYNQMMAMAAPYIPANVGPVDVQGLIDMMSYIGVGFILNYEGALDRIVALNPDVEVVLLGLMNTTYGMEVTGEGFDPIPVGDIVDILFDSLNAYIAGLPAVKQAMGEWENAEFYYADMPNPEFIVQVFDDLYNEGWPADYYGLSGATVRARTIKAYNEALRPMIGLALGFDLPVVTLADAEDYTFMPGDQYNVTAEFAQQAAMYNGTNADSLPLVKRYIDKTSDVYLAHAMANVSTVFAADIEKEISIAIYLALEEALATSVDSMEITLDGLMGIAGDIFGALGAMPEDLKPSNNPGPDTIKTALVNWFTGSDTALAMCKIFAMFKVGDGMSVHPTPKAHGDIYNAIKDAYANKHTAADETIENLTFAAEFLADLVAEYYDDAYAYAYDYAKTEGYIAAAAAGIDAVIAELAAIDLSASQATDAFKAEVAAQIAEMIETLAAAKALLDEADVLDQAALDALMALLTEAGEDAAHLTHLVQQAGDDTLKLVVVPALETAYDVLMNEVLPTAKEQLGIAVAMGTELLMEKAYEAYEALVDALVEAAEVYGPEAAAALYDYLLNNPEQVIGFFAEYGPYAAEFFAENAEEILMVLGFLVVQFGDEAVAFVMENPEEVLQTMVYLLREYGDEAWALIVVYAEAMGITGETIQNGLADALEQLSALVKEYGALIAEGALDYAEQQGYIAALEQAIEDLIAQIEKQIDTLENQVCKQLETAIAALEAQLESLEAQLEALKAELENASEELKAEIEAAIEAIEEQIEAVKAQIEALKAELEVIHAQIVELYEAAIALNDAILALIEAANAQTEETIQAAIAAIENAMQEVMEAIDDAKALIEAIAETVQNIIDAVNAIPEALEKLDEMIIDFVENLGEEIVAELNELGEELLANLLDAANALVLEGIEALAELVEDLLTALVDALKHQLDLAIEAFEKAYLDATTGEYAVGCDSYYVALGDAAAVAPVIYDIEKDESTVGDSYADILAAELELEYADLTDAALTTAGVYEYAIANAAEIAKADLITVSLGTNDISGFILENLEAYINGKNPTIDWTALNLSDEMMDMLSKALAKIHGYLAEQLAGAEAVDTGLAVIDPLELVNLMVDSYLFGTLSFTLNFAPALNTIHAINPDAHVVVVGMANPFGELIDTVGFLMEMDLTEVNDILTAVLTATNLEFLVYTMLTPNTTFVPVPEAKSNLDLGLDLDASLNFIFDLAFQTSEEGHAYIADRILNALTIGEEDHAYGEWIADNDETHTRTCTLCGVAFETEDHDFGEWISAGANHVRICETCEYVLTGEHADDNDDHECDVCDAKISDCADADNDHKCDICGDELSVCVDADNDHECDICGEDVSVHADANNDHKCDICGEDVSVHADANNDHKCDICGEDVSVCADANNDHKCDICGTEVSVHADANNDHKCDTCGETVSEHADANNDHKCDICGGDASVHTDANKDHKCDICGTEISEHTDINDDDKCDICGDDLSTGGGGGGGGSSKPAITPTPAPVVNPFIDVHTGDYFYNAVLWAVEKGITTGVTETIFAPNDACTRAQMVTMLWRAMGSPAPKSTSTPFTDLVKGAYYYDAVLWGTENGLIKGTSETTFSPEETISRCETVTFLWRSAGASKATSPCIFNDVDADAYYYDAVVWATKEKVTNGTSATTFSPEDPCLRGQIVTLMFRHMGE